MTSSFDVMMSSDSPAPLPANTSDSWSDLTPEYTGLVIRDAADECLEREAVEAL